MTVQENATATKSIETVKQSGRAQAASAPIRVKHKTRTKLDQLLRQANKDRMGRRVKADDVIAFALDLVTGEHLASICSATLSNKDRFELLFAKLEEKKGLSREQFLGLMFEGKFQA